MDNLVYTTKISDSAYAYAVKKMQNIFRQYLIDNNRKAVVIGMSGGIDSALTAALAGQVCAELEIPLVGRSLPIMTNKPDEVERAARAGKIFCSNFGEKDLTSAYTALHELMDDIDASSDEQLTLTVKIREGNIKARTRMIYLYDLARKNDGLVLSTDNYTELMLGFWTLHGDVGDFGLLQNIWKTEVYEMARFLCRAGLDDDAIQILKDTITAVPTDGLGITNSDLDQLGAGSYEEVDKILMTYLSGSRKEYMNHPVIIRHLTSVYKRANPVNIARKDILPSVYMRANPVNIARKDILPLTA